MPNITVAGEEVALQPHDFFKKVQPIKGASTFRSIKIGIKLLAYLGSNYFLKSIFHDGPDKACIQILTQPCTSLERPSAFQTLDMWISARGSESRARKSDPWY